MFRWQQYAFSKPLNLLSQMSGFPNLLMLYSIFACLGVSSASAERALSKLKIIKNRLRSTMSDDFLSSLMIISAEKDLLALISNHDIIERLSTASPGLQSHLMY